MVSSRIADGLAWLVAGLACGCGLQAHDALRNEEHGAQDAGVEEILIGEIENARDLGGTPLEDGEVVAYGELFRGPPLTPLTEAGCAELERLGIRTIIDLRTDEERATKPDDPCAQQLADVVLAPLPVPYSVSPQDYVADLNTTESIVEAFRALGDEAAYPIYFHCTWGRDRTGVLAAVILLALGADRAAILDEYLLSQTTVGAYPLSLEAVLDEVDRRGGIDAFLASTDVPDEWVAALRANATSAQD
jgi:protein tyrosine phosphatase (PTP) superfamily phosphohydrolase (DUF442 family)